MLGTVGGFVFVIVLEIFPFFRPKQLLLQKYIYSADVFDSMGFVETTDKVGPMCIFKVFYTE